MSKFWERERRNFLVFFPLVIIFISGVCGWVLVEYITNSLMFGQIACCVIILIGFFAYCSIIIYLRRRQDVNINKIFKEESKKYKKKK